MAKKRAQKTKIDWNKARKWYMSDSRRSYEDVAKKFGVAKRTVEHHAKTDGDATWADARQELGMNVAAQHDEDLARDKAARSDVHLTYYRELQDLSMRRARDISNGVVALDQSGRVITREVDGKTVPLIVMPEALEIQRVTKAVKLAIDGERIILGMPTSVAALTNKDGEDLEAGWAAMITAAEQITRDAAINARTS